MGDLPMGREMNEFQRAAARTIPSAGADMSVDVGLRGFMLGVYNKLAIGLVLSAALAYAAAYYPPLNALIFKTPLYYVVAFSPIVIMLVASFAMKNPSPTAAGAVYWAIVTLMGLGLGVVFLMYTGVSVAKTFLITAAAFGALSLWGYTTKKDLSGMGTFLIMGMFGLIIASIVNIFLKSSAMEMAISYIGVLIFSGLIAYDTQRLKNTYYQLGGDARGMAVATSYGALSLYLNFINLFMFLLRIMGNRN
jgi:uncharacterized protein